MRRHEFGTNDAIAIQENAVSAVRPENCTVADFRRTEALVGVPHMFEAARKFRLPDVDQLCGGRVRPVVSDEDLEIAVVLYGERPQHRVECVLAIESRYDHGNQFGHWRPLLPALAEPEHADKPLGSKRPPMVTCGPLQRPHGHRRICKRYQPIFLHITRRKRSKPPYPVFYGPTKSLWLIHSALIARPRSRALSAPVSSTSHSEASATCETGP